jgi:hypothetical protein
MMSEQTRAEDLADLISMTCVSLEHTEQGNPYVEIDGDKIAERIADEIRAAEQAAREPLVAEINQLVREKGAAWGIKFCCSGYDCGCQGEPVDPPTWWHDMSDQIDSLERRVAELEADKERLLFACQYVRDRLDSDGALHALTLLFGDAPSDCNCREANCPHTCTFPPSIDEWRERLDAARGEG